MLLAQALENTIEFVFMKDFRILYYKEYYQKAL